MSSEPADARNREDSGLHFQVLDGKSVKDSASDS